MFQRSSGYYMDSDAEVDPSYYEAIIDATQGKIFNSYEETRFIFYLGDDVLQRPVLMLVSCFLPPTVDELDKAMRYTVYYTREYVKNEFILIQCLTRTNILNDSSGNFLQQFYSLLPVEYKKNLKKVIMFHYGVSNRALLTITSSYMSPRFMRKLEYADTIKELYRFLPDVPEDELLNKLPYIIKHDNAELLGEEIPKQFSMSISDLCLYNGFNLPNYGRLPAIIVDIVQKLSKPDVIIIPNLFHLQTTSEKLTAMINEIDSGVPFRSGDSDIPTLVSVFKLLLNSLEEPLLGLETFQVIVNQCKVLGTNELTHAFYTNTLKEAISKLKDELKFTTKFIVNFLHLVSIKSSLNNMTTRKIAEIFAPAFCRPYDIGDNPMYQVIPPCVECINVLISDKRNVFAAVISKEEEDDFSDSKKDLIEKSENQELRKATEHEEQENEQDDEQDNEEQDNEEQDSEEQDSEEQDSEEQDNEEQDNEEQDNEEQDEKQDQQDEEQDQQ